jgi:hypothetical protein
VGVENPEVDKLQSDDANLNASSSAFAESRVLIT